MDENSMGLESQGDGASSGSSTVGCGAPSAPTFLGLLFLQVQNAEALKYICAAYFLVCTFFITVTLTLKNRY